MQDILVVNFSRSGYTQRVADQIARAAGADRESIRERSSRKGLLGYWRSAREALRGSAIDIEPASLQPRDYSLVVLGTPVWAGNVSAPMRAYIAKYCKDFLRVALFCTQGGSGAPKVLQKMTALCDQLPVATAFFNDADIDGGRCQEKIDGFCAALTTRNSG